VCLRVFLLRACGARLFCCLAVLGIKFKTREELMESGEGGREEGEEENIKRVCVACVFALRVYVFVLRVGNT
jgi:hypothetical protein